MLHKSIFRQQNIRYISIKPLKTSTTFGNIFFDFRTNYYNAVLFSINFKSWIGSYEPKKHCNLNRFFLWRTWNYCVVYCRVISFLHYFYAFFLSSTLNLVSILLFMRLIFCSLVHCWLLIHDFSQQLTLVDVCTNNIQRNFLFVVNANVCVIRFFRWTQPYLVVGGFIEVFYGPAACPLVQHVCAFQAEKIDLVIIGGFCPLDWIQIKVII